MLPRLAILWLLVLGCSSSDGGLGLPGGYAGAGGGDSPDATGSGGTAGAAPDAGAAGAGGTGGASGAGGSAGQAQDAAPPGPDATPTPDSGARDLPSSSPPCALDIDCRGVTDHNGNSTHCFLRFCGPQSTGEAGYCTSSSGPCTTTGLSCFPNQVGQRCVWTGSDYQCLALVPGSGYCSAGTKPKLICSQEFCAPT